MERASAGISAAIAGLVDDLREELNELKKSSTVLLRKVEYLETAHQESKNLCDNLEDQLQSAQTAIEAQREVTSGLSTSVTKLEDENKRLKEGTDEVLKQHNELVAKIKFKKQQAKASLADQALTLDVRSATDSVQHATSKDMSLSHMPLMQYGSMSAALDATNSLVQRKAQGVMSLKDLMIQDGLSDRPEADAGVFKKPLPKEPGLRSTAPITTPHNASTLSRTFIRESSVESSSTFCNSDQARARLQTRMLSKLASANVSDTEPELVAHSSQTLRSSPPADPVPAQGKRRRSASVSRSSQDGAVSSQDSVSSSTPAKSSKRRRVQGCEVERVPSQQFYLEDDDVNDAESNIVVVPRKSQTLSTHNTPASTTMTGYSGAVDGLLGTVGDVSTQGSITKPSQAKLGPQSDLPSSILPSAANIIGAGSEADSHSNAIEKPAKVVSRSQLLEKFNARTDAMQRTLSSEGSEEAEADDESIAYGRRRILRKNPPKSKKVEANEKAHMEEAVTVKTTDYASLDAKLKALDANVKTARRAAKPKKRNVDTVFEGDAGTDDDAE